MGKYGFVTASTTFILLLNFLVVSFPAEVNKTTGLDTESLQETTDVSASVDPNQTSQSNVLGQTGSLVNVYTKPSSENRILGGIIFTVLTVNVILLLIDIIWVG